MVAANNDHQIIEMEAEPAEEGEILYTGFRPRRMHATELVGRFLHRLSRLIWGLAFFVAGSVLLALAVKKGALFVIGLFLLFAALVFLSIYIVLPGIAFFSLWQRFRPRR